jgi:hypothetical protein
MNFMVVKRLHIVAKIKIELTKCQTYPKVEVMDERRT